MYAELQNNSKDFFFVTCISTDFEVALSMNGCMHIYWHLDWIYFEWAAVVVAVAVVNVLDHMWTYWSLICCCNSVFMPTIKKQEL